jgi:hypothetical protein
VRGLIIALLLPFHAFGHGLEPSRVIAVEGNDGQVRVRLNATNRYQSTASFTVEAFTDKSFSVPMEIFAIPNFTLQPNASRKFVAVVEHDGESMYVCTRTIKMPGARTAQAFSTRVCSKVVIYRRPAK